MIETLRHGLIPDLFRRRVIHQGNSEMITLKDYLKGCDDILIYVLENNKRHLLIEIDKNPKGV